jgi:hypothetical protein
MKLTMNTEKPGSVFIAGRMREPDGDLGQIAVWAFEIFELAGLGCCREA